jgi:predicted RNase H-like HicB family nuclease
LAHKASESGVRKTPHSKARPLAARVRPLFGMHPMHTKMRMIYWRGESFWLGKLLEHPEIMAQGRTLKELEANMRDAYLALALEDVPKDYRMKVIAV